MGISAVIGTFLESVAGSVFGAGGLLGTIGTSVGAGLIEGAGLGTLEAGVTGGNLGKGALFGAVSGGVGAGATAGLADLGVGGIAGDALGGSIGGLAGGLATGGNLGKDALLGGALGGAKGVLGGTSLTGSSTANPAPVAGGGTGSAAATAAPASIGAVSPDATALAGGTSAPGTGGGGAGLPGSVGTGAAGGTSSLAGSTTAGDVAGLGSGTSGPEITVNAPTPGGTGASAGASALGGAAGFGLTSSLLGGANDNNGQTTPQSFATTPSEVKTAIGATPGTTTGGSMATNLLKNPSLLLSAAPLVLDVLKGNQMPAGYSALSKTAGQDAQDANQLKSYQTSGTLPTGLQAGLNTAADSAAASIRSQYAARGMSGSSAEAADLQALNQRVQTQGAQIATQLYSEGVQESQLSSSIYEQLMKVSQEEDQQTSSAIGSFASALAGMGRPAVATGA